ncbi:MAG: hypothetical protein ABIY56_10005 [Dokdonella sp.]
MNPIGGIEPITLDGRQHFFGFSFSDDRVLTPLFPSAELAAEYAVVHLAQRDGAHGKQYWLDQARNSLLDPSLADSTELTVSLKPLKADLLELQQDQTTPRTLQDLAVPKYLAYLLETNCDWPDSPVPANVEAAAVRLGLEADDMNPWLEESSSILSGKSGIPAGASFHDAATVFIWYFGTLVEHQQHNWSEHLGLVPGAA